MTFKIGYRCKVMLNYERTWERIPECERDRLAGQSWQLPFAEKKKITAELMSSVEPLKSLYGIFTSYERDVLHVIMAIKGSGLFRYSELERWTKQLLPASNSLALAEFRLGLAGLRRYGLIIAFKGTKDELEYLLPTDCLRALLEVVRTFHKRKSAEIHIQVDEDQQEQALRPQVQSNLLQRHGLVWGLFTVFIYMEVKGLKLTKEGFLYKKQIQELESILALTMDGEALEGIMQPITRSDPYSPLLALILDIGMRLGLLCQQDAKLVLNKSRCAQWLSLTHQERNQTLFQWFHYLFFPKEGSAQIAAFIMETKPVGKWFSLNDLERETMAMQAELLSAQIQIQTQMPSFTESWVKPIHACGWLDMSLNSGESLLRWRAESEEWEGFYVQPDFEILTSPCTPLSVLWELEQFCELISSDAVFIYRLTLNSVTAACRRGCNGHMFITFLHQYSLYAIAAPVIDALLKWISLDHQNDPKKAEYNEMTQQGLKSWSPDETLGHLLSIPDPLQGMNVDICIPDTAAIYPGMNDIPIRWIQEMRQYHGSVRKEMIRKAIEWQSYIRVRTSGLELLIVPQKLKEQVNNWKMVGIAINGELELEPAEWDEMQIVLPGIHHQLLDHNSGQTMV